MLPAILSREGFCKQSRKIPHGSWLDLFVNSILRAEGRKAPSTAMRQLHISNISLFFEKQFLFSGCVTEREMPGCKTIMIKEARRCPPLPLEPSLPDYGEVRGGQRAGNTWADRCGESWSAKGAGSVLPALILKRLLPAA